MTSLILSVLSVIGHGYHPPDDANRHVAKVISGKEWKDILVVREDFTLDSHPGWHWILNAYYRLTGTDKDGLLVFSIVFLFLLFTIPALFLFRHQEAWILALLIFCVVNFGMLWRLLLGRPFIFTMSVILLYWYIWQIVKHKEKPFKELFIIVVLSALSAWVHGSWFFMSLFLVSLLLAGEYRAFKLFAISIIAGIFIASIMTGNPPQFFYQSLIQTFEATSSYTFKRQLVSELQPFTGEALTVIIVLFFAAWRTIRGDWDIKTVVTPVFIMMLLCWVIGYIASRFWSDWGWPCAVYWIASEIDFVLNKYKDKYDLSIKRLGLSFLICIALFMAISNDRDSRWTSSAGMKWPSIDNKEESPWLPDKGGIVYTKDMGVFYGLFYENPKADFRYILGFEPIWMPKDDLKIYREIQLKNASSESFLPWIKKMKKEDRLIIISTDKPDIKGIKWHKISRSFWSGLLEEQL